MSFLGSAVFYNYEKDEIIIIGTYTNSSYSFPDPEFSQFHPHVIYLGEL